MASAESDLPRTCMRPESIASTTGITSGTRKRLFLYRARPAPACARSLSRGHARPRRRSSCRPRDGQAGAGVNSECAGLFMDALDNPFSGPRQDPEAETRWARAAQAAIVDCSMARPTAEKMAFGHFWRRARASAGDPAHTHVPTADYQFFSGGTAYMTDAGMCGDYDSVIGNAKGPPPSPNSPGKMPGGTPRPAEAPPPSAGAFRGNRRLTGLAKRNSAGVGWRAGGIRHC